MRAGLVCESVLCLQCQSQPCDPDTNRLTSLLSFLLIKMSFLVSLITFHLSEFVQWLIYDLISFDIRGVIY